jgi:Flp pilus assembly protein TadD
MRLSPHDPYMFDMQTVTSLAHFFAGRFAEALPWAEAAAWEQPNFGPALKMQAASSAMTGRHKQAQSAIAKLLELQPSLRISNLQDLFLGARQEGFTKWVEALRIAGLPE